MHVRLEHGLHFGPKSCLHCLVAFIVEPATRSGACRAPPPGWVLTCALPGCRAVLASLLQLVWNVAPTHEVGVVLVLCVVMVFLYSPRRTVRAFSESCFTWR